MLNFAQMEAWGEIVWLLVMGSTTGALLYYAGFLLQHAYAFSGMPQSQADGPYPGVSILIPVRNEAAGITATLQAVCAQQYPPGSLEVLVLDDHSEDDTVARARVALAEAPFAWQVLQSPGLGKKAALSHGVATARHAYLLTLDGDSMPGPRWAATMLGTLQAAGVRVVTGPVRMQAQPGLGGRLQALESAGLIALGAAGAALGRPHLANGANLGFTRATFEALGGYASHMHFASGEDEMLVQQAARAYPGAVRFCKDSCAIVETPACADVRSFWQQRLRWVSKGRYYPDGRLRFAQLMAYLGTLSLPLACIGAMTGALHVWLPLGLMAMKSLAELAVLLPATRFLGHQALLPYYPLAQLLYIPYVLAVGLIGNLRLSYTWKGRRLH